jgi:hypothetical protein
VVRSFGRHYDVVITTAGESGARLLSSMNQHPGGCGPVIAEASSRMSAEKAATTQRK